MDKPTDRYYQSYSISFLDPWFGGKRPNSLSVSHSTLQTDVSDQLLQLIYEQLYGYFVDMIYYYGGYYDNYESYYDPDKSIKMFGLSVGLGKRLRWPDDYFTLMAGDYLISDHVERLDYLYIMLNNGRYMNTGNCNNKPEPGIIRVLNR